MAEQIERLADDYEIHLYSSVVRDVPLTKVFWHRLPALPGPHLFTYCWWFIANHLWRSWDRRFRSLNYDLVFSPGINCLDADVTAVHIVFAELLRSQKEELRLGESPLRSWVRLVHRRMYYRLIATLERVIYTRLRSTIIVVAKRLAREISRHFQREQDVHVIYNAVSQQAFNPELCLRRRKAARQDFGLPEGHFTLLLIGNGWRTKGLASVLHAMAQVKGLPLNLLVVGRDDRMPYEAFIRKLQLDHCVRFLEPSSDVLQFYAASDVYVGPSLHDSFAIPPLEAMACGLPVITSSRNGGSEIITNGVDGFVLEDPRDSNSLAELISLLFHNEGLRQRMGEAAAKTARQYTWERNAEQLGQLFREVIERKMKLGIRNSNLEIRNSNPQGEIPRGARNDSLGATKST